MAKLARLPGIDRSEETPAGSRRTPRLRTRFYAFLSYSHKDKELADWLHRELERFRVPTSLAGKLTANGVVPRRLMPIFRDQQDLSAGADLAEEIKAALAASQFLVVLCSPTAATSRWTNAEIESFKRTRPEGCVLAAVAAGEPFASEVPGREHEECFPPALRYKYDRRGHQTAKRAEPLAADFRENHDGRRLAFLKLIAGMLGVGLDELVQRETTRRHQRLAWLAAGSLAGMAVTSTLALAAFQARNEAREQRRQAEGLVEFMLGDLRAKLEPIGKLDALDGVGSRVLDYYKRQDASELSDAALLQRSRALNLMAEVAFLRGHLDEADGLYRQAMSGTAEAVRRSPSDTKRLFDHAQNIFWVGEISRYRGQFGQAEAFYREYKRLGDELVAREPDNLKWRMEGLYGEENVGIALYDERRFADAANQFRSARSGIEKLASIDASNQTYQNELSNILAWVADTESARGNFDLAIAGRKRQILMLEQAIAHGSTDVAVRQSLIPAHQALGILLAVRGEKVPAIAELRQAMVQADHLIPVEPANGLWKKLAAGAGLELASNLISSGSGKEASQETDSACSLVAKLRSTDPGNANVASFETTCLSLRARLATGATESLGLAQQALASARAERSGDPMKDRFSVAAAYRLLGDSFQRLRDGQKAKEAWASGLALIPSGVAERPLEMQLHAELLHRVGLEKEARTLDSSLSAIGYKYVN